MTIPTHYIENLHGLRLHLYQIFVCNTQGFQLFFNVADILLKAADMNVFLGAVRRLVSAEGASTLGGRGHAPPGNF